MNLYIFKIIQNKIINKLEKIIYIFYYKNKIIG